MKFWPWLAGVRLQLLLLIRDWHALALLFAMPLVFLLVMSVAMQDQFAQHAGRKIGVLVVDADQSKTSKALIEAIDSGSMRVQMTGNQTTIDKDSLLVQLRHGQHAFAVIINSGYGSTLGATDKSLDTVVTLLVAPDTSRQTELIFGGTLREILARQRLSAVLGPLMGAEDGAGEINLSGAQPKIEYASATGTSAQAPSAVQQNVPAWLVFGMFFIVIPLSNALIRERQQGTLRRLQTMPIGRGTLLASKFLPYFVVNQLQVVLMLAAGCFVVPMLGGEALQLRGSPIALALVCIAVSMAALGYALCIATLARTSEQASLLGGAGNLILAAIGGIMVPKFVMPESMQRLSDISPMSWGLQAFLDILLRDGSIADILGKVAALVGFGIAMLLLAQWLQRHQRS
jgi:ABC-2 type transport system permease protein